MTVPDFQSLMLPLLKLASDREEHTMAATIATLADQLDLDDADRAELLPGGSQRRFHNRVYWAKSHLRAAGLVASPTRGRFRITPEGETVLAADPPKVDMGFLRRYPDYLKFLSPGAGGPTSPQTPTPPSAQTPDEIIASTAKQLNDELAQEILTRIGAAPPDFLERLVVRLLRAMGYGGTEVDTGIVVGGSGDEGIDGVIRQDKLGLDRIYVQAKRWSHPVSSPEIRNFIGSLQIKSASRGVFISTSTFTGDAIEAAGKSGKQIVLIDGPTLARYLIENNVGVAERATYVLKEIDTDFFDAG